MTKKVKTINNRGNVSPILVHFVMVVTLIYFTWWLNINHAGNLILYSMLFFGEVFHVWQAIGYAYTVINQTRPKKKRLKKYFPVDVFITVCGEPVEIVEETLKAATSMDYPHYQVYVLNDGRGADKDNWKEIDALALRYGALPITREKNTGAKAGNVNNALRHTYSPFIAVFDSDHVPDSKFLKRTMGYFTDPELALVQTPQFYENKYENFLTKAAWEQQELFFGPICTGKNRHNATFWCGTNAVIRRRAIESIGGVPENNIAEDFLASLFMHSKGWKSIYIPEVLARGLAPHNLGDYVSQQFRWARGSLEVIFKYNPIFRKGLSLRQKFQYLYSASYYLNGLIVIIDAIIPLLALGFDALPVKATTSDFMIYFFPFIFSTIYLLMMSTRNQITFNSIQLSMSSFFVFFVATISTMFGIKAKFKVTPKNKQTGNYLKLVIPHLLYTLVAIIVIIRALITHGLTPPVVTNTSWAIFNIVFFWGFVRVAYPWELLWRGVFKPAVEVQPESIKVLKKKFAFSFVKNKESENFDE